MPPAVTTPIVNGNLYSFASIEFEIDGLIFADVTAIDYADPVKPGKIYGTGGVIIGRTPGISEPTMSVTLTRRCWDMLRAQLAGDAGVFSTKSFTVRVTYFEARQKGDDAIPEQLVSDIIEQVRVIGPSAKNAAGPAATVVVIECDPWRIRWGKNGNSEGQLSVPDDSEGDAVEENDPVNGSNVPSQGSATWWSKTDDGFEAAGDGIHAPNTWDTFTAAGIQFPGLCKVTSSRPPSRAIEEQKPNGSDAAAMIDRGYLQATIDIEITLWMRAHFSAWEGVIRELWQTPGKASKFEEPIPATAPKTGPATPAQQQAQVARTNAPILREIKAINSGRSAVEQRAIEIYHPALALLGVSKALVESPGVLVAGTEPQTFVTKIKLRQYLPAAATVKNTTKKTKGSAAPKVGVTDPLKDKAKNSPKTTPGETQGKPG